MKFEYMKFIFLFLRNLSSHQNMLMEKFKEQKIINFVLLMTYVLRLLYRLLLN